MKTGLTISGAGHAAVLLWSVLTLVARPYHVESTEALPVDVISATDFSQITNGAKNAPQLPQPKPLVDKLDTPAPVDDPTAKLAKKEVKAATDVPPPAAAKPPEPKAKKPPPPAPDPIADALKKDEDKQPDPKKAEVKPPPPPPKKLPPRDAQPQFDPRKVEALLDKRDPQRLASAGDTLNGTVSMGDPTGTAAVLSQTEIDALRARLAQLWNPPAGAKDPQELVVEIEFRLKPDGTVDGGPRVITTGRTPLFETARTRALQAIFAGQPFTMLKPEHYDQWKDIVITFDPRYMSGG